MVRPQALSREHNICRVIVALPEGGVTAILHHKIPRAIHQDTIDSWRRRPNHTGRRISINRSIGRASVDGSANGGVVLKYDLSVRVNEV